MRSVAGASMQAVLVGIGEQDFLKKAVFTPACRKEELRIMREVVEVLSGIETSGLNV